MVNPSKCGRKAGSWSPEMKFGLQKFGVRVAAVTYEIFDFEQMMFQIGSSIPIHNAGIICKKRGLCEL